MRVFFFFQAEDGIRDYKVTGVQTCALPISPLPAAQTAQQVDLAPLEPRAQAPANLWRVQVFVTQDRSLADRMAKEAAQRLNVNAHGGFEASPFQMRLWDFQSEDEAQPL